jgi:hypothetical protein
VRLEPEDKDYPSGSVADRQTNSRHCDKCFCWVCDRVATQCSQWEQHCMAVDSHQHWQRERKLRTVAQLGIEHLEASKLDCVICFDSFAPADGISCHADAGTHFLCNTCFETHVKTESETEAMDLLAQREGCVFCPMRQYGCEETPPFTDAEVARHCSEAVFVIYNDAKKKLVEARLATQIGAEERARMDAELERRQKMSDVEREVEKACRHIEDMLYLRCPRCKTVFVDFTNDASLTCGKAACGCAFCAWCQKDCGDDAHQHVANCPEKLPGADTMFPSHDEVFAVFRKRRRTAITTYLRDDVKTDIQPLVAETCRVVLTGAQMGDICDLYVT